MERIKISNNAHFACSPVNITGDETIYIEDLVNAVQFSGSKFTSVKGKLYLHASINKSFTFVEFGVGGKRGGAISYAELVSKIKKYGLQSFIKIAGKWYITNTIELV